MLTLKVILSFILIVTPFFSNGNTCDKALDLKTLVDQNLSEFEKSMEDLPNWKRKLFRTIWTDEIRKGNYKLINDSEGSFYLRTATSVSDFILLRKALRPYILSLPIDVVNSYIQILKAKGIKNITANDLLIIPARHAASNFVSNPFTNVIFIGTVTTGGLFQYVPLVYKNPISDIDISKLKDNEIILIFHGREVKADSYSDAELLSRHMIDGLERSFPKHVKVVSYEDHKQFSKDYFNKILKNKKIKKLIFNGHGSSGRIYDDYLYTRGIELEKFSDVINTWGIPDHFVDNVEILFGGCLIAYKDFGKNQVRQFAKKVIKKSGRVEASNFFVIAAGFPSEALKVKFPELYEHNINNSSYFISPRITFILESIGLMGTRAFNLLDGPSMSMEEYFKKATEEASFIVEIP